MIEILKIMVDCINNMQSEYIAKIGYKNDFAERPVLNKAVYFTVGEVRAKEVDFVIYVYSPVSLGGNECVNTACEVCNLLYESGFGLNNVTVGAAEYNSASQGFVVKIKGTAEDFTLSYNEEVYRSYGIQFYNENIGSFVLALRFIKVDCAYDDYSIETIFSDVPIDGIRKKTVLNITLDGIPKANVKRLTNGGRFNMKFIGTDEEFQNCYVKSVSLNGEDESAKIVIYCERALS